MANITRIKASDPRQKHPEDGKKSSKKAKKSAAKVEVPKKVELPKKAESTISPAKTEQKSEPKQSKQQKEEKSIKKAHQASGLPLPIAIITWPIRMLGKPFVALGRYIKSSWMELRQVRWPSRGATWKMTLAALIYTGLLIGLIMLLDVFFTWLFNLILS